MQVVGIEHVQLAMPPGGEERARAFYSDLLGIPEVPKPAHLAARGGAWFERGALKVHLGVEHEFRPARKAHPALLVEGLRALVERLRGRGWAVEEDPGIEGFLRVYVHDPFGNRIELMEARGQARRPSSSRPPDRPIQDEGREKPWSRRSKAASSWGSW